MKVEVELPGWLVALVRNYQREPEGYMHQCLENMRQCASRDGEMAVVRCAELIMAAKLSERGCKRCGEPLAYPGALFCGAACSAMYEAERYKVLGGSDERVSDDHEGREGRVS